ncbi:MAG: amidohydrolase family protein [Chloroflexi bacterium]|nr:amidohydrolase family protein [Chloroflexota bacterium]
MVYDLAINNGLVVNADGQFQASIGIRNGVIATISSTELPAQGVIDAAGKLVMPGVIDAHAHFDLQQGQGPDAARTCDDYVSGPRAAACSGVTTFIDFAIQKQGQPARRELEGRIARAKEGSGIDFSFHAGITDASDETLSELASIMEMGVPSFKFFLTYRRWGFAVDLGFLYAAMAEIRKKDGVVAIHGEHDEIVEYLREMYHRQGKREMIYHSLSRPDFSEEICFQEAIPLARETGVKLYLVHVSTEKGLRAITAARWEGVRVYAETCPHYLAFTAEVYRQEDGVLYTMTPPLRPPGNREALWQGVVDGRIDVVAADHNSFSRQLKPKSSSYMDVAPGVASTPTLLPYLYTTGVAEGRISPSRLVELLCANPARIYGVPNKGVIAVGYDADINIIDPQAEFIVRGEEMDLGEGGYTIFEGWTMRGRPEMTISRGQVVAEKGRFVGQIGRGRFIERGFV